MYYAADWPFVWRYDKLENKEHCIWEIEKKNNYATATG